VQALCAGGDIKSVALQVESGEWQRGLAFFRAEYELDYLISRLAAGGAYLPSIAQVALMDGYTMGGGAGLCMHGAFRVATERYAPRSPKYRTIQLSAITNL
jgi:enoyl-CoA hydratase/carnithine racemase